MSYMEDDYGTEMEAIESAQLDADLEMAYQLDKNPSFYRDRQEEADPGEHPAWCRYCNRRVLALEDREFGEWSCTRCGQEI